MRKYVITCDVCNGPVDKFLGAVTLATHGTDHGDACSPKCTVILLRRFANVIETKEGMRLSDNEKFAADSPEAVLCAACTAGLDLKTDNAAQHTGQGAHCKNMKEQGPCLCSSDNWKSNPADSSTPGPREVTCFKCGNVWTAQIRAPEGVDSPVRTLDLGSAGSVVAPAAKRKGRPPGSGKKAEPNGTNATDELAALKQKREQEEAGSLRGPGSAFSPEESRDATMNQPPRWCRCGKPLVFSRSGPKDTLGAWSCVDGHELMQLSVRDGQPGENLSQTVTEAAKHGISLNLVDFAQWPYMRRITLSEWIRQGCQKEDRPDFLDPDPPPPPLPAPVAPAAPPLSRFTF
jgi:hypothetical protein